MNIFNLGIRFDMSYENDKQTQHHKKKTIKSLLCYLHSKLKNIPLPCFTLLPFTLAGDAFLRDCIHKTITIDTKNGLVQECCNCKSINDQDYLQH
jgi:uncharacterized protein YbcC (UPF0753/DUF2309 family)